MFWNPFRQLNEKLDRIINQQEKIMAAIDDLNQAVTDLGTAVTAGNAQIESELQTILNGGSTDAQIEAAVANIRTILTSQNDEVTKAQQALGGPKKD
jgi:predicted  nucleic acid-binding Zn-ribbon protein